MTALSQYWIAGLSALALALAPVTASAQEGEEAPAEETVEEAPPAPPEPPRKLKRAAKQFKSKEWALAALSFYSVLQDPEAEFFHSEIHYYLAQCLENLDLPYSSLEEYNRFLETVTPDSKRLTRGIERAVSLARRMEAGWIIAPGLAGLDTSRVAKGEQGPAMFWIGQYHYRKGNFASAKAFLGLVPKGTEFFAEAHMLEGISLTRQEQPGLAIPPLVAATQAANRIDPEDNTWEVANLNLARAYYAVGNFERAIEHFERTPRSSPLWFESLYEASWAYFRMGRLSGALSHLQTVDSPFFDTIYHPDATLLRVLLFYYLCKYVDGQEMLNQFTAEHREIEQELQQAVDRAAGDPEALFEALYSWKTERRSTGIPLPEPVKQLFSTDESLVRIGDYLAGIDRELRTIDGLRTGFESSRLRKDLEQALKDRHRRARAAKGREVSAKLQTMLMTLQGHLGNAELYKIEMITAEKDLYTAAWQGQILEKRAARKRDIRVPGGYRYWPFQGEYWEDELGWYEVDTINECVSLKNN